MARVRHGKRWLAQHDQIKAWLDAGLTVTNVHALLGRRGVVVPFRTLHRYATTELGFGRRKATVRVADGELGAGEPCSHREGRRMLLPSTDAIFPSHRRDPPRMAARRVPGHLSSRSWISSISIVGAIMRYAPNDPTSG